MTDIYKIDNSRSSHRSNEMGSRDISQSVKGFNDHSTRTKEATLISIYRQSVTRPPRIVLPRSNYATRGIPFPRFRGIHIIKWSSAKHGRSNREILNFSGRSSGSFLSSPSGSFFFWKSLVFTDREGARSTRKPWRKL